MAYVRSKIVKGKTYRYLVKSVRDGQRVQQVLSVISATHHPHRVSIPISPGYQRPSPNHQVWLTLHRSPVLTSEPAM